MASWWGVALPQATFALPVTVVILVRSAMPALPDELEEAALMDGFPRDRLLLAHRSILQRPGMITVGVLGFVGTPGTYLLPLLLLRGDMGTLPSGWPTSPPSTPRHRRRLRVRRWR
ncbi:MAG: ABC transporter permease subunit [Nocardioidaceae bacterium]